MLYFVTSGDVRQEIEAKGEKKAVVVFVEKLYSSGQLGEIVSVSRQGWMVMNRKERFFSTDGICEDDLKKPALFDPGPAVASTVGS